MSFERVPATVPARPIRGRRGAVASPHYLATEAGLAILRAGGSAVDAAIATNAALAVVAGHSCGLGGDAFWIIWDVSANAAVAFNGSGRSGSGASIEAVRAAGHREMPARGPWSVTVPGAIESWGRAHDRYGKLPWDSLLVPAIELADGFPAGDAWVAGIERASSIFGPDGDWALSYRPDGHAWRVGQTVRLVALGRTLRRLADEGPATAYSGRIGARSAEYFAGSGVPITAEDLAGHKGDWVDPIGIDYRGVRSLTHPPNSVGVIALQTLAMLGLSAAPSPGSFDGRGWADAGWVHLGLEASRLALSERDRYVTDPASMEAGAVEQMLSTERLREQAARIRPDRTLRPLPRSLPAGGGTVYLTTADRWGGLVSLLESNYQGFGSGLVDPETGISFQDRGAFFRLDPTHANALAPGKRSAHTLSPGMLLRDGVPWIAHGAMGGEIQPQVFTQFVSAVVDGRADIATAVAAPRWIAEMPEQHGFASHSVLEDRIHPEVAERLREIGHDVVMRESWSSTMGHEHAIELVRDDEGSFASYAAAADPRSDGLAAAF